ncbi:hypothetical protein ACJMK2_039826 [Sinanodonta woodiana]|uniref:Uncharacterized protein n=1 Tax=Sinanodonta woodiana TaxID=1069815 RepID=A0ABD3WD64_SINWO
MFFVDRREEDEIAKQHDFLIEPSENCMDKYSLIVVAHAIVDTKDKVTQKLRVLNPYPTSVSINQDTCIGQAYRHDGIQMTLFDTEDNEETGNFSPISRIKVRNQKDNVLARQRVT